MAKQSGAPTVSLKPLRPTIEIVKPSSLTAFTVGSSDPVATETEIGLWDNAFERRGADYALLNEADEKRNLLGSDSRRFYIRVIDVNASGLGVLEDNVEWWTSFEPNSARTKSQDDPPSKLTLFEVGTKTGIFVSKALMIVNDAVDRSLTTDSGVPKGHPLFDKHGGIRRNDQSNYRFRRGGMFSWVVASYTPKNLNMPSGARPSPGSRAAPSLFPCRFSSCAPPPAGNPAPPPPPSSTLKRYSQPICAS